MHPNWVRSVRDQCQAAGVPFFFKQWGEFRECEKRRALYAIDPRKRTLIVSRDGSSIEYKSNTNGAGQMLMERVGTKTAGHLIDGREWREFPC